MSSNLLRDEWSSLDSVDLRILIDKHISGPGQYQDRAKNPDRLYLPLAGDKSRIVLSFKNAKIVAVNPGPAFDTDEWERISDDVQRTVDCEVRAYGRDYAFCSRRVMGSWRGEKSGVQILPPPIGAPVAPFEMADHPFILEFPMIGSDHFQLMNHRRIRELQRYAYLLDLLLNAHMALQASSGEHFWAVVRDDNDPAKFEVKWVQNSYFGPMDTIVSNSLSEFAGPRLAEFDHCAYYKKTGDDGTGLSVPDDLDASICTYQELPKSDREMVDRATYWMNLAHRHWPVSKSASFAALVTAIESLTEKGTSHSVFCELCKAPKTHEVPGATQNFRSFFDAFAPGVGLEAQRKRMYELRSRILHGGDLMQLDQHLRFGVWDPPYWGQKELHDELWNLARIAIRNWLRAPR